MKEYLKERYISKATGRLFGKKVLNDSNNGLEPITSLIKGKDYRKVIYDILHDIVDIKICNYKNCNNLVRFNTFSLGYSKFCCIKCSKNPDEIKNINIFGGVHLLRKTPHTSQSLYFKKAREYTRLSIKMHYDIINPKHFPLGRCGVDRAYQIDHKTSIKEGYDKNIDPKIIGSVSNLQTIPWRVNSVKGTKTNVNLTTVNLQYIKKNYNLTLNLLEFIEKYCIDSKGNTNHKLCKKWFENRNALNYYEDIMNRTSYLNKCDKVSKRVTLIRFGGDLTKKDLKNAAQIRELISPMRYFVNLAGDDKKDFDKHFNCFDKSINRIRPKSNLTKKSINKKGLLYLWYKYKYK